MAVTFAVWGTLVVVLQALVVISAEDQSCVPGFQSDMKVFSLSRKHLWRGRVLGKDCSDRTRFHFRGEDTCFVIQTDGVLKLSTFLRLVVIRTFEDQLNVRDSFEIWDQTKEQQIERYYDHLEIYKVNNVLAFDIYFFLSPLLIQVNRRVSLHKGHHEFLVHAWDSQGNKMTIPVRVVRSGNQHQNPELHPEIRSKSKKIFYCITGPGAEQPPIGLLTIDTDTGNLYLTQTLDRDKQPKYLFQAYVVEDGAGNTEKPMKIIVNVIDQNDNKPLFAKDTFLGEVAEASLNDRTWVIATTVLVLCLVIVALLSRCLSQHKKNPRSSRDISALCHCQTTHMSQIDVIDVQLQQLVDHGHFATVWRTMYQGSLVAVKVIPSAAKHVFITEKDVYELPLMRHASIIHFLGAGRRSDDDSWLLVLQIAEYGSLYSFLHLNTTSWPTSLQLCLSLSQGLSYLHSDLHTEEGHKPPVAHRDLCSFNVLVQADCTCALCDFGNSSILWPHSGHCQMENTMSHTQTPGTLCYISPEILEGSVNLRSWWWCLHGDVYALGLVLWEICMRCSDLFEGAIVPKHLLPYERELEGLLTWESLIVHVCHKDIRPAIPEHWQVLRQGQALQDILRECWDLDPEARLTAECVVNRLIAL
ncbi:anti-Muellerian hormone type-2 receptor-like [Syngnathoides biaculeatus]|uniref:anti-Muellerian hormone type-2 receptor-like n=1 Tax=Syngnathoides biaculeatus TaxID=300417 RepID=UPI002ADE0F2D|nr:anti-Muellerian hormone type-2 receptor-like [Syngnathoides biaculeatus]